MFIRCLSFFVEFDIDFGTFLSILTRPDGFKPAGSSQEFIQGFQVFDKEGDGYISAGELRYGKVLLFFYKPHSKKNLTFFKKNSLDQPW